MKKSILALSCALALTVGTNYSNAQALEEGNIHLDVYVGGPNLIGTALKAGYANSQSDENLEIGGLPLLGVRFGYMVADKISVGVDINYTNTSIDYTDGYDYSVNYSRLKAMARFEFHFGSADQFDLYMPVAVGYKSNKLTYETNDPNDLGDVAIGSLFPVAIRVGIGGRYYFTDNIGLNLEFGLGGGAILEGGLAFKF